MTFFLIVQLLILLFFLYQLVQGSKLIWGVGLLAIGSAVLLNLLFSTLDGEELRQTLGFWLPLINGTIFAGAGFWLFGLLQQYIFPQIGNVIGRSSSVVTPSDLSLAPTTRFNFRPDAEGKLDGVDLEARESSEDLAQRAVSMRNEISEFDQKLLFQQIYQNLGLGDVQDLIFDLDMVENEVVSPDRNMVQTINNIMDLAYRRDQMSDLALAVERILTPLPPDHFPRLSRITTDSPRTILRRYLLTFYTVEGLEEMAVRLDIDWERLGLQSKQQKVRNLLLYVIRRRRLGELIDVMQMSARTAPSPSVKPNNSDVEASVE